MKVLIINVVCGIRSTGRICTDMASALEAQGHEVKIAYGRECVPEQFQKYAVRIGSNFDVRLHGLRARLLDGAGFGSKQTTARFIQWVEEYDPDVIHLHNIHGYYINIEVLFKYLKICKKRIIWTLHDCWSFTGHSAYCDAVECERWLNGCGKCPQIREYPKSFTDNSKFNWLRKKELFSNIKNMIIVTPSKWLAELVKKSFLSGYPVKVINNGVNISQFKLMESDFREQHKLEDKFILLGVATAWDDMKGYSDFIELSRKLDDSYKIVMVGLTDKQIKKLPDNIIGIRRTACIEELVYIYSSSDILLNLSYCDTYPTINLEARACGLPIITYATGGSPESAGAHNTVVKRGDLDGVVYKIKQMGNNHQKNIEKLSDFDKSETMKQYMRLYKL